MKVNKKSIAEEYRARFGPEMPNLTLARVMYKENKKLWTNVDAARTLLRSLENKSGNAAAKKKFVDKGLGILDERPKNPFVLPNSVAEKKPVFKLPLGCNRILFLGDFQVPFHDTVAIEAACRYGHSKNINTIFLNGDIADFFATSFYEKDPRKRDFQGELDAIKAVLTWLRAEFPDATIYYNLDANHELRWTRYMQVKAPELLGVKEFELETILQLNSFNIIPLKDNDYILIGKLVVLHGHTLFGRFGAINKARKVLDVVGKSAIASHVHVTDECTKKSIDGSIHTAWTVGACMSLHGVDYAPHTNQYNHGFAYIETDMDDNFRVENKRVLNGVIL
jgi:hypothetical protein